MSYTVAIKTAIFTFPLVAFLFTIPFILHNYHKYGSIHWFKTLIVYTFILYLMAAYFLVILPLPTFEEALKNTGPHFNFIPFSFLLEWIKETSLVISNPSTYLRALKEPCFYVVIFNIFMTIPFGMYLHYYFKCDFKKTTFYTFLLSLFFEITQGTGLYFIYPNPYRLCDIDDLLLNTMGGIIGYFIMKLLMRFLPSRERLDEEALERGKKVSGLRRLTVFFLDFSIYFILSLFISLIGDNLHLLYLTFILYYIILPLFLKNQTLAMRFLNVRIEYNRYTILKSSLRSIFLAIYYFYLPIFLLLSTSFIIKTYQLNSISLILYLISLLVIFLFYMINALTILIKKKIFYDYFFGMNYKSTILESTEQE